MTIRSLLISLLGGLLIITSSILIFTSYLTSERVILNQARQILENLSSGVLVNTENFLKPAEGAADLTQKLARHRVLRSGDVAAMERYFFEQLHLSPHFAGIYFGTRNGGFIYVKRDGSRSEKGFRTKIISSRDPVEGTSATGSRLVWRDKDFSIMDKAVDKTDGYDPRKRPWYKKALRNEGLIWTDPYIFFTSQRPGVTTAIPVYNGAREIVGVIGVDIEIDALSTFLASLKIGERGTAFILNRNGDVIAFPEAEKISRPGRDKTDGPRFTNIAELEAPVSRAAVNAMWQGAKQITLDASQHTSFDAQGERHHAIFVPFPNPNWPWIIGIHVPEDDFLGSLKSVLWTNILFVVFVCGFAGIIGVVIARHISQPVVNMQRQAKAVAAGNFNVSLGKTSLFKELQDTSRAFDNMAQSLREQEARTNELTQGLRDAQGQLESKVEERTRELGQAKEEAEEANLAKSKVLAAASHDLRQPLQALSFFIAALQERSHDDETTYLVNRSQGSLEALENLLNLLLDLSRLDAGLIVPEVTEVPVGHLIEQLASEFGAMAVSAGLEFRYVPSTQLSISSDRTLLERILRNLLSNALRHTDRGRILFGCRRVGGHLRIEVWDTGPGIAEDKLKSIFQDFYQIGNEGRTPQKGLGIGLAIVARLSSLMGHEITVRSEPGRGSVFMVKVPLTEVSAVARIKDTVAPVKRTYRILAVDDDTAILESMTALFKAWGHDVISAESSVEAASKVGNGAGVPELIIADYRLAGGETGSDAIAAVRKACDADIPALLLTGDTAPDRLAEADRSGFTLLHKPIESAELRAAIDEALK